MILTLAAIALAAPDNALPLSALEPVGEYMGCLFDDPRFKASAEYPSGTSERTHLAEAIKAGCASIRAKVAASAQAELKNDPDFGLLNDGPERVEGVLRNLDWKLKYMIVDREKFVERATAYEKCLDEKGMENC